MVTGKLLKRIKICSKVTNRGEKSGHIENICEMVEFIKLAPLVRELEKEWAKEIGEEIYRQQEINGCNWGRGIFKNAPSPINLTIKILDKQNILIYTLRVKIIKAMK